MYTSRVIAWALQGAISAVCQKNLSYDPLPKKALKAGKIIPVLIMLFSTRYVNYTYLVEVIGLLIDPLFLSVLVKLRLLGGVYNKVHRELSQVSSDLPNIQKLGAPLLEDESNRPPIAMVSTAVTTTGTTGHQLQVRPTLPPPTNSLPTNLGYLGSVILTMFAFLQLQ